MMSAGNRNRCLHVQNITMPEKLTRSVLAQLRQKARALAISFTINLYFESLGGVSIEKTVGHASDIISNTS